MVDFKNLETFVWVSRLKSFRMAASRLHTTQPAISYRIAQLEGELGVQLLERDKRSVVLTPAGLDAMDYALKLLELRSEFVTHVGSAQAQERRSLRLGVSETMVHTILPGLIEHVSATYPNLSLDIGVDAARELHTRLMEREIDLALAPGPLSAANIECMALCSYPCGFYSSPTLGLHAGPLTVEEVSQHPIITLSRTTRSYETVRGLLSRHSARPLQLHAISSVVTAVAMAVEGLGIAVMPAPVVAAHVSSGRLVRLDTDVGMPPFDYSATWVPSATDAPIRAVASIAASLARELVEAAA